MARDRAGIDHRIRVPPTQPLDTVVYLTVDISTAGVGDAATGNKKLNSVLYSPDRSGVGHARVGRDNLHAGVAARDQPRAGV